MINDKSFRDNVQLSKLEKLGLNAVMEQLRPVQQFAFSLSGGVAQP